MFQNIEEIIHLFNTRFFNMLNRIKSTLDPRDDAEFFSTVRLVDTAASADYHILINYFCEHVYMKYREQILSKDVNYFMNDLRIEEVIKRSEVQKCLKNLRVVYAKLSPELQEITQEYFVILIKLCDCYIKKSK